jgi:hypothetical protein
MKNRNWKRAAICLALAALTPGGLAAEPLKYGDPLRKELMNAVRPRVERTLRTKVIFNVHQSNRVGDWAFMTAEPKNPDGSAIRLRADAGREAVEGRRLWRDRLRAIPEAGEPLGDPPLRFRRQRRGVAGVGKADRSAEVRLPQHRPVRPPR